MARFVLVHGSWHGAWCFERLLDALVRRGHEADAVDLPCDTPGLTVHDYARVVGPQPDAVVVGHSKAAMTIPHVEARLRVFLAGLLPVSDDVSDAYAPEFGGFVRDELDRSYWPDVDVCARRLYPDCPRAIAEWAWPRLRRQARVPDAEAPFGERDVVVATMRDAAIRGDWQAEAGRSHGARVVELDAGHFPFLARPDEVADVLDSLG